MTVYSRLQSSPSLTSAIVPSRMHLSIFSQLPVTMRVTTKTYVQARSEEEFRGPADAGRSLICRNPESCDGYLLHLDLGSPQSYLSTGVLA